MSPEHSSLLHNIYCLSVPPPGSGVRPYHSPEPTGGSGADEALLSSPNGSSPHHQPHQRFRIIQGGRVMDAHLFA